MRLLDKALLAANASQLKVVWQLKGQEPFFELQVSMLIGSIILQLIVALLLWYETMTNLHDPPNRLNYEHRDEYEVALRDWWNNNGQRNRARHVGSTISTLFIIVILFMNIIIAVFGVNIPPAEKHFNGNIPINESLERN
ncbi:uncharacterized protein LOC112041568 isoform X2 [Lingula anatina]|uniref:Uncharacterized protein LOC106174884 isoform X2 n=1 Tax=Lingula anatina TaxID=7574 RepID=A0A1S3JP34_LINAN|nr:uncharacterized protein LOC106174884 isoform X2 [Lingula anatina]XP_023930750.1 uncharacterized protein LOC112041568 isoform X2 [Lingula anatina]|eukprot:XP_013412107.1 uncharacterized protein LOC106174884 isoform X2 [Lingula anatina]